MSDRDDSDPVPRVLLTVPTEYQSHISTSSSPPVGSRATTMSATNPPLFADPTTEIKFRQRVLAVVPFYDGDPDTLSDWLRNTGAFFATEFIPDAHQVFALRFLLTDHALDLYNAHDDLIRNFNDLRKLLLHTAGKASLRTLASLDTITNFTLTMPPPGANSTRLDPNPNTTTPFAATSLTFTQSSDDLTQHEYRKSIIAQFQTNKSLKFSGEHKQDVVKWLEKLERKFELADISDPKKFDYLTELLEKGALNWFLERKASLNRSWPDFVQQFKKIYDSPGRAQLAFQKLQLYHQSADQDIRSFCSAVRKLCTEYDPEMSKKMKLDFLLRSVNPTYRPEILKRPLVDADDFEQAAVQVENIFLTLQAYESNSSTAVLSSTHFPQHNANHTSSHPSSASNYKSHRHPNHFRSAQSPQVPTAPRAVAFAPRPSHRPQQFTQSHLSPSSRPQNLFAYTLPTSAPPLHEQHAIPPLMPPSSLAPPAQQEPAPSTAPQTSQVSCQLCNQQGHSARDCPF